MTAPAPARRGYTEADRAQLRARVASAGAILAPTWPLGTFVAVNPLGGLQHHPFEEAVRLAGDLLRLRGHLPLAAFRAEHERGRVRDADLDAALHRRFPDLADRAPVRLAGRSVPAVEVLRADLVAGAEPVLGPGLPRGAAEWCDRLLKTSVAPLVDEQVAKWCAAFCADRGARWGMPGRAAGLYAAWRAIVGHDPAVRRLGLAPEVFGSLPPRADDAVLAALDALHVPTGEHRAELREQLARLPGWGSHIKWREEHPDQALHPADLVELLAIRLTYEAALVRQAAGAVLAQGTLGLRVLVERALHSAPAGGRAGEPEAEQRARVVACALGRPGPGAAEVAQLRSLLDRLDPRERGWVWLDAYEWHYRDELLTRLDRPAPAPRRSRPAAQLVCCIDARSEGLRRQLEACGDYETFGFPGFFQLAVRFRPLAGGPDARLSPAPLVPTKRIRERPADGFETDAASALTAARHAGALADTFHRTKEGLASPFALADAAGWFAGPLAAARTLAPRTLDRLRGRLGRRATPRATELTVDAPDRDAAEALVAAAHRQAIRAALARPGLSEAECERRRRRALAGADPRLSTRLGLTPEAHAERVRQARQLGYDTGEQVAWADFALRSLGLTGGFAPIVLLTGHGSRTENNAFEAALDCGACGGRPGGANARLAGRILNRPAVRAGLAARGIHVPDDTLFVAAEHDTATDRVTVLDPHAVPAGRRAELGRLLADLEAAGGELARERARRLPGPDGPARRARDWAQVRPEWGLARHGAFVVGPGSMVSGLDLECRTFLHSYDWRVDPDGRVLETVLTAPGLVVQWINAQYYFSAVDPDVLGAGDKTLHNVVGGIGVLEGHGGDLRLGLPWQSVAVGDELYHEPMRALFVVQAPPALVDTVIARSELLQQYFDGAWLALVVREGAGSPWLRRAAAGAWLPWRPAARPARP